MEPNYVQLALCMKALADETRLRIIAMLSEGELCACRILEEFNITQPTLSYHMKILCDRGLVNSRKDGVWMRYSLNHENLAAISMFISAMSADVYPDRDKELCKC